MPSKYAAIVTLDPAGTADCGIAVRFPAQLSARPQRGKLSPPAWTYQGSIWNGYMWDELSAALHQHVRRGDRVLLAVEDAVFRSRKIARGVGRGTGALEALLHALNLYDPADDLLWVTPATYRHWHWPDKAARPVGRDEWKAGAVELVERLYGMTVGEDQAEATLISDYVTVARRATWAGK